MNILHKALFVGILLSPLCAELLPYDIFPANYSGRVIQKIEILDAKELRFENIEGYALHEISAATLYDSKLYLLSDRAELYIFSLVLKEGAIEAFVPLEAFELRDHKGRRLSKDKRDSEGMFIKNDRIYVSFEKEPRVDVFSMSGKELTEYKLPKKLRKEKSYESENKGLEALAYSEKYGVLTAPEEALENSKKRYHTIYSQEQSYRFLASAALSSMEFMDEDSLMVLEREYQNSNMVVILKRVDLSACEHSICNAEVLASFESKYGWKVDNFEALAKVGEREYIIFSDDNYSPNQKNLMVYFRVLP